MNAVATPPDTLFAFLVRLGDDNLVLAQRLGEWISRAPDLEEDIALGNIGLDHLGVARACYKYAADAEGADRSEDDLAFLRTERDFTNLVLFEQPNGDFAHTMARHLLVDAHQRLLWERLARVDDPRLAGIAAKARKESEYHFRHSSGWVIRLGDGTDESHRRMQSAIGALWKYVPELLATDAIDATYIEDGDGLRTGWDGVVDGVLSAATLLRPEAETPRLDGRRGLHSEHLGHLLTEMQWMQRTYPGVTW